MSALARGTQRWLFDHLPSRINRLVGMGEAQADQEQVHRGKLYNVPSDPLIGQPKVEFPQMPHRISILLVLPPYPLTLYAKATLETVIILVQKPIIG